LTRCGDHRDLLCARLHCEFRGPFAIRVRGRGGVARDEPHASGAEEVVPTPFDEGRELSAGADEEEDVNGRPESEREVASTSSLNPALNGESRLDKSRLSTMVVGARYAQRCPVEFGVPMEVVIAA
jgi:hypothetical protein